MLLGTERQCRRSAGSDVPAKVDSVPSPGIKQIGSATEKLGKVAYDDNGNLYRYISNEAGATLYQGEPVFYNWTDTADYKVGRYIAASSYEAVGNSVLTSGNYLV